MPKRAIPPPAGIMPEKVRRILVVKPSSLGDILHTFPAVELLRRRFPEAELDWLVHPAFAGTLKFSPFPVRRAIFFRRRELGNLRQLPREFLRLTQELRREKYDLIIDFQGLMRSAIFGFLARGPRPVGFAAPRERSARLLYGDVRSIPMEQHAVERNVALVNSLLGTADPVPQAILPPGAALPELPAVLAGKTLIGVVPGARWETKCFAPELFAGVIRKLHELRPDCAFVIIGAGDDAVAARAIMEQTGEYVVSLVGKTGIEEMIELMRHLALVLSNDSGPVHAAAAQGTPVVGFFGPTRPELTGPYGAGHRIFQLDLACSKCMKRHCPRLDAGGETPCHRLDAGAVAAAAAAMLADGGETVR